MNTSEIKHIIDPAKDESLTWDLRESNAGDLHLLIYRETPNRMIYLGLCPNLEPENVRACIEDLENWRSWDGFLDEKETRDWSFKGLDQIACTCVTDEGLVRYLFRSTMGIAGRKALAFTGLVGADDDENA